jgi:acyl-CoA thioesterase
LLSQTSPSLSPATEQAPPESHPFDQAITLQALTDDAQPLRRYSGQTHFAYDNMVGPFGGITAAQALSSVMNHPMRLGEPIAFTGNFAAALTGGSFEIETLPVRTNRSTQHWQVLIRQAGKDGVVGTVFTATVVTALRRQTWSAHDAHMPQDLPDPQDIEREVHFAMKVAWLQRYDVRPIYGSMPREWDEQEFDSRTLQWIRDCPQRPLDFLSLTSISDTFYPRVWRRRAKLTPIGTVSITIYFHASGAQLASVGTDYLLNEARGVSFFNGFFDQSACIWRRDGHLLVTTHQIVYYKE